ncbi:MAG: hypothetical protein WCG95_01790, partial [bacterium]
MPKFALKLVNTKKGRMMFKQLVILDNKTDSDKIQSEINNCEAHNKSIDEKKLIGEKKEIIKGVLDLYEEEIEHSDRNSLKGIFTLMDLIIDLQKLSKTQFRPLQPKSDDGDFEIKRGDLRIFGWSNLSRRSVSRSSFGIPV